MPNESVGQAQVAGDWRDPAIFARLDAGIAADVTLQARKRPARKAKDSPIPLRLTSALEKEVIRLAARIRRRYPTLMEKRALPTKKLILSWMAKLLPPFPRRSGRPAKPEITKAAMLNAQQQREVRAGSRIRVDWSKIASECIPGWSQMRKPERERERNRLRNSVGARKVGRGVPG